MPVDVGAGKTGSLVQPRDSRSLDIVHFTAELAPIAKVSCWDCIPCQGPVGGTALLFPGGGVAREEKLSQLDCQF